MEGIVELGIPQVATAYVFVLFLLLVTRIKGLNRERIIIFSSLRMTLQLVLAGYVLSLLFAYKSPWLTLAAIGGMELFAILNIFKRVGGKIPRELKKIIVFSISSGTLLSLFYFIIAVVRLSPWYDPRYFIPLAGMIIGNSMTGISLGTERMQGGIRSNRELIEGALMLGASPQQAVRSILDEAFDAAFMPTLNSMVGMGIVFLPGMMTGQILSGIDPQTAIAYQIAIMLGILGSVTISVFFLIYVGSKTFFNRDYQLVLPE